MTRRARKPKPVKMWAHLRSNGTIHRWMYDTKEHAETAAVKWSQFEPDPKVIRVLVTPVK